MHLWGRLRPRSNHLAEGDWSALTPEAPDYEQPRNIDRKVPFELTMFFIILNALFQSWRVIPEIKYAEGEESQERRVEGKEEWGWGILTSLLPEEETATDFHPLPKADLDQCQAHSLTPNAVLDLKHFPVLRPSRIGRAIRSARLELFPAPQKWSSSSSSSWDKK